MDCAATSGTTDFSSSTEAALILSTEPKCFKRALRRAGPIPGMESSREAIPNFCRFLRCAVMPYRWASSRMRCTKYKACEWRGNIKDSDRCGKKISSCCFARPTMGIFPAKSDFPRTSTARHNCPLPPSIMIRSGKTENDGSCFTPTCSAVS